MKIILQVIMIGLLTAGIAGCGPGQGESGKEKKEETPSIVRKKREDGTLSSVNPVDADGFVHGIKVNYYEDGKTVHSRITYDHGKKQGPALWYYKNGQIHEHTAFQDGQKHGLTRKYYENGTLLEEVTYEQGEELPGKKAYSRSGELVSD